MADWSALYDSAGPAGVLHVRAGLGLGVTERMLRRRAVEEDWPLHSPVPTAPDAPVAAAELPRTGSEPLPAGLLAAGLVLAGSLLLRRTRTT